MRGGHRLGRAVPAHARIVDQDVEPAPRGGEPFDRGAHLRGVGEVAEIGDRRDAELTRLGRDRLEPLGIDVDEEQVGAFARERKRERAADAGRSTGHQRFPAPDDAHSASRAHDYRTACEAQGPSIETPHGRSDADTHCDHRGRVRRDRARHQAAAGRPHRLRHPGEVGLGRRRVARQHLSGRGLRRAFAPLFVFVRPQGRLAGQVRKPGRHPELPRRLRAPARPRSRISGSTPRSPKRAGTTQQRTGSCGRATPCSRRNRW